MIKGSKFQDETVVLGGNNATGEIEGWVYVNSLHSFTHCSPYSTVGISVYVYHRIYIYIHVYVCIYIYIQVV